MKVLVTGASGYIGGRLVPRLIARGHAVRCLSRSPKQLVGRFRGVSIFPGDALEPPEKMTAAFAGVDVAYYLIHSMRSSRDFARLDRTAARNFAMAAKMAGVKRVIYLGGLGARSGKLSAHLRSRQDVAALLREYGPPLIELRAAIIIGSGSASFEMIRYLTERLPVMIAPRWVSTRCQPIAVDDVLEYLVEALESSAVRPRTYDIGGADALTYRDLMLAYARARGLRRTVIDVPLFTPRLSSYWVHLVTPVPANIAQPLIDGLQTEVVVKDARALRDFQVRPMSSEAAIRRALDRYHAEGNETTWFDTVDARRLAAEFQGVTEGMLVDRRERTAGVDPAGVWRVITALGGSRGWLYADWIWAARGALDWLFGGVGMRRGRRSLTELRVGDALDFWRVETLEPEHLLRLRAEMKLPGRAWLEFRVDHDLQGTQLQMTAFFEPRGVVGQLYWWAVAPFHKAVFDGLANEIVALASRDERAWDLVPQN